MPVQWFCRQIALSKSDHCWIKLAGLYKDCNGSYAVCKPCLDLCRRKAELTCNSPNNRDSISLLVRLYLLEYHNFDVPLYLPSILWRQSRYGYGRKQDLLFKRDWRWLAFANLLLSSLCSDSQRIDFKAKARWILRGPCRCRKNHRVFTCIKWFPLAW